MQPGSESASSMRVNQLLMSWTHGDKNALNDLLPLLYEPLRKIAHKHLKRERRNHTLQSAALVNEAYLRLLGDSGIRVTDRSHFIAVAAQVMRHILVEHARHHHAAERGGGGLRLGLEEVKELGESKPLDLVTLDDALHELSKLDSQQARIVEMRFFGGLSIEETASILGISPATVKRDWATARVWLYREISRS